MRILNIGPLWRGSNAGGLFRALSREGCLIEVVDEFYFVSLQTRKKSTKILERIIRPLQEDEFNRAIKKQIEIFRPDILFVYKGVFVTTGTLSFARSHQCKLVLFYPDVSMSAHGANIPKAIPMYDLVFTTKTFGINDLSSKYGVKNAFFIPHGFDPDIHRKLEVTGEEHAIFGCDVSFVGNWSPKKEKWLAYLKEKMPDINMKIWGDQWGMAAPILKSSIQGRPVLGDLYALAIQCSTINLGILSEQVTGASSGDLITSRTFHIPAASGFMLHERNEESVQYYKENEEAAFFDGPDELVSKVADFMSDDTARERIRLAGHKRALADHSLDGRAKVIIERFKLL